MRDSPIPAWPGLDQRGSVMHATSADIDLAGKTYVVLYWAADAQAVGYNLYRARADGSGLSGPLNGAQPIVPVQTCAQLQTIIPRGSPEWELLANAFTGLAARKQLCFTADTLRRATVLDRSLLVALRGRAPGAPPGRPPAELLPWEVDPCAALERGLTAQELELFDVLASSNLKIRLARGLAWIDSTVEAEQHYLYGLGGVLKDGSEVSLAKGVEVWVGHFRLHDPPSGLAVAPGDRQVLALWNRNPYAFSYTVRRSLRASGPYQVINAKPIRFDIKQDLQGSPLTPPRPGFLDFQRWNENGLPVSYEVNGVAIDGPANDVTYYYEVASCDILDRQGRWSLARETTPVCTTPPMAPGELRVEPCTTPPRLTLSWRKVTRDVANHQILDTAQTYCIYRAAAQAELEDLSALPAPLASVGADPTDPASPTLIWTDSDPALVPPYGEQDFWYRLRCVDLHGNQSAPSAIVGGRIPDTRPPGPTHAIGADGYADHIRVFWEPNSEPDLAGYQIYRGICDRGKVYYPKKYDTQGLGCDMLLVGTVSLAEAKARQEAIGRPYFDDYSVPQDSPLCYAYWVRAYDAAQNLYPGAGGCPVHSEEYVCQRLDKQTPPPAPVMTALKARSDAVLVEWIAAPVQDLRAFHIYRSDREDEAPTFVGCALTDGTVQSGPWIRRRPSCGEIPAELDPATAHGSFLDQTVEPHRVYWYRVSALDWLGNESEAADLTRLPAISTFTYSRELPPTPTVLPPFLVQLAAGCGLAVRWSPTFDPQALAGFVVFRSTAKSGNYRQVSPVVAGNAFSDASARRGVDYWYRVQALDQAGALSNPSTSVRHRY